MPKKQPFISWYSLLAINIDPHPNIISLYNVKELYNIISHIYIKHLSKASKQYLNTWTALVRKVPASPTARLRLSISFC